ncbi:MAG TPA: copper-binding protein [Rhodothermales bacterium]
MLLLCGLWFAGCGSEERAPGPEAAETAYEVRGVLQSATADSTYLTIAHERIPGYMDAMTMTFRVADTARIPSLMAGDSLQFTLVSGPSGDRIHGIRGAVE